MAMPTELLVPEIEYPTSDGRPMAETDVHRDQMVRIIDTLNDHFAQRGDVYVTGNLMVYYEKGTTRHRSPDVMVVFGVPKGNRDLYKTWEEKKYPDFVLEITSRSTQAEDMDEKFLVYRDIWKVKEYFLFDPIEEYLEPSIQGFRLVDGEYEPIKKEYGQLLSEVLGIRFGREGLHLVMREPGSGRIILRAAEERARQAELAAELAEIKARFAIDEREMTEMLRKADRQQAEESLANERQARERAEADAEREKAARLQAEAETERLRAEIAALRQNPSA